MKTENRNMDIYVILLHSCTEELDEADVIGVYSSLKDARNELKSFMDDVYSIQSNYYGVENFDPDFLI